MPQEWINILENNGIKINKFYCKSLYKFFIFKKFIISLFKVFIKIIISKSQIQVPNKKKIYFHDFEFGSMPKGKFDKLILLNGFLINLN